LIGRLLLIDALTAQFRTVKIRRDPTCPACGTHEIRELIDYDAFCGGVQPQPVGVKEITPRELAEKRSRGDDFDLIDVREPNEWQIARIEGARLVPLSTFPRAIETLDASREIVVQCKVGGRSARAADALLAAGFQRVWNLAGGITRWSDEVDPTVPKY
jgi:adenylyltransferase/sulfurtransferase